MLIIRQTAAADLPFVEELFGEYLQWANGMLKQEFNIDFDAPYQLARDMADIAKFMPPDGRLLLAIDTNEVGGCACMRTIAPAVAELKRMYVRPAQRRRGIGRALVEALIADCTAAGYTSLRLDSARFMQEAHTLYRSMGFEEIAEYPQSEIPPEFRQHWVFMERIL
jgi:GNAT superfamily N-acetyltransferase